MVRKLQKMFIMVSVLGLTLTGAIFASAANNNSGTEPNGPALEGPEAVALAVATAGGNARLVALIDQGGTIIRSAGVHKVTHPVTGVYCIKPKGTWAVTKVVPAVSAEFGYSNGESLLAYYYSAALDCPDKNIEVRTYDFSSGTSIASDHVAFTIVVP